MGDPKFRRKTYSAPRHPWDKTRIDAENELVVKYGLKNKRELWKSQATLASFRTQARNLQAKMRISDPNARVVFQKLINRLNRYKILGNEATLDDVLSLPIESVLDRRLQTIVHKRSLARTVKQARQLITHGHITLNGRRVNIPGVLVEGSNEESVQYFGRSPIADPDHPLRKSFEENSGREESPVAGGDAVPAPAGETVVENKEEAQ